MRLTKYEMNEVKNQMENYKNRMESIGDKNLGLAISQLTKEIKVNASVDRYENFVSYTLGERDVEQGPVDFDGETIDEEDFSDNKEEIENTAKTSLLSLYVAAKEKIDSRSKWSMFFHPFRTRNENNALKELEQEMKKTGIEEDDILDYQQAKTTNFEEVSHENIEVDMQCDLEDSLEEFNCEPVYGSVPSMELR